VQITPTIVDRPQKFSPLPPVLYGLIPQTYSAEKTAAFSKIAPNGDGDPLDLCVLSDLPIISRDVLMDVRVVGGIRLIDSGEVDDKIIAVLDGDPYYKNVKDINDVNEVILNRMKHYFLSYKTIPGEPVKMQIESIYGAEEAFKVIKASMEDYQNHFGNNK
jgi:inorganic pyrophosphatase